jgi:hypothetical protein
MYIILAYYIQYILSFAKTALQHDGIHTILLVYVHGGAAIFRVSQHTYMIVFIVV